MQGHYEKELVLMLHKRLMLSDDLAVREFIDRNETSHTLVYIIINMSFKDFYYPSDFTLFANH